MFKENFPTNTQVGTAWVIKMTANQEDWSELTMGAPTPTHTRSGTSVIRTDVPDPPPPCALIGLTTNWLQPHTVAKSKAATTWRFVVVEPNHYWWWPFKSPTNRKEALTSSACTAAIDVGKQSKIWSSGQHCSKDGTHKFCLAPQKLKNSILQ